MYSYTLMACDALAYLCGQDSMAQAVVRPEAGACPPGCLQADYCIEELLPDLATPGNALVERP